MKSEDILADIVARFGRVPVIERNLPAHEGQTKDGGRSSTWAAGGLVFDDEGRVVLVKHRASSGWADVWVTPGGILEAGERADDAFRREVREETGLEISDLQATRIFRNSPRAPSRKQSPFSFVQFVARAASAHLHPDDPEIREVRWFDALPEDLAFREDYLEDFAARQEGHRRAPS